MRSCKHCGSKLKFRASVYDRAIGRQQRGPWTSNYAQAKGDRTRIESAIAAGTLPAPCSSTVGAYLAEWLTGIEEGRIRNSRGKPYKPSVIRSYRTSLQTHVLPTLGTIKLTDLRRRHILELIERLGLTLSGQTVKNAITPLQAACRRAMDQELISTSPCLNLRFPAAGKRFADPGVPVEHRSYAVTSTGGRERVPSREEAEDLIAALPDTDQPLWATAFYAGLRRGELQALDVERIDFGKRRLYVIEGWDQVTGKIEPKYDASTRTVPMSDLLVPFLKRQVGERANGPAFPSIRSSSQPFRPGTIIKRADKAWEAAGIGRVTLHEARHCFASIAIAAGVPLKLVSTWLGHSSVQVTEQRYVHLIPATDEAGLDTLNHYLSRSPC